MRTIPGAECSYGNCIFGCLVGDDSIEHYAHCTVTVNFLRGAGIRYSKPSVPRFLMIARGMSKEEVCLQASCLYALYLSHGILRHSKGIDTSDSRVRGLLRASLARSGCQFGSFFEAFLDIGEIVRLQRLCLHDESGDTSLCVECITAGVSDTPVFCIEMSVYT